ncbi:hypothetical protein Dimus_037770, partial [Dionaea muscipula]
NARMKIATELAALRQYGLWRNLQEKARTDTVTTCAAWLANEQPTSQAKCARSPDANKHVSSRRGRHGTRRVNARRAPPSRRAAGDIVPRWQPRPQLAGSVEQRRQRVLGQQASMSSARIPHAQIATIGTARRAWSSRTMATSVAHGEQCDFFSRTAAEMVKMTSTPDSRTGQQAHNRAMRCAGICRGEDWPLADNATIMVRERVAHRRQQVRACSGQQVCACKRVRASTKIGRA